MQRPARGRRGRVERVTQFVDAESGEADAEKSRRQKRQLHREHLQTVPAIPPSQREQTARELPVGCFGFGGSQYFRRAKKSGQGNYEPAKSNQANERRKLRCADLCALLKTNMRGA